MAKRLEDGYYVSNSQLCTKYIEWYADIALAKKTEAEDPQIPPFIVDAMIKIANRLSYNYRFIGYSFKDEMISDALYDCIRFAKKFNTTKSDKPNPFSYLTTICFNAFLRRIDKEKTQSYTKSMLVLESPISDMFNQSNSDDDEYKNMYVEFLKDVGNSESHLPMSLKRALKIKRATANAKGPLDGF